MCNKNRNLVYWPVCWFSHALVYLSTVNSEVFTRVLLKRSFTYTNKMVKSFCCLVFTDKHQSCPSREFITLQLCLLTLFVKIKQKISA